MNVQPPAQPEMGRVLLNCRDLGGIPTRHGRVIQGSLWRSGGHEGSAAQLLQLLEDAGISRVVDLRSAHELDRAPSPLAGHSAYVTVSLVDPHMEHLRDPAAERDLAALYRGSVDRNGRTIAAAVRQITDAPEGGVLVHCAAGKDRTGILIGILLDALGSPPAEITADYGVSESELVDYFSREIEATDDPRKRARLAELRDAPPRAMDELLAHVRATHGGGAAYLKYHGLNRADLARLRKRLVHGLPESTGDAPQGPGSPHHDIAAP